jgi:hypothetical protein
LYLELAQGLVKVSSSQATRSSLFDVGLVAMLLPASSMASIIVTLWLAVRTGRRGIHDVELIDDP